jgi:hypothetical protein
MGGALLINLQYIARVVGVLADAGFDDHVEEEAILREA